MRGQRHRREVREASGDTGSGAELTLMFVSELVEDQLSVEAIHRVYRDISRDDLIAALETGFELIPAGSVTSSTLAELDEGYQPGPKISGYQYWGRARPR